MFKYNKNGIFLRNYQVFKRFSSFHYYEAELVLQNTIISFFIILNVQKHMQDSDLVFIYGSGAGKNHKRIQLFDPVIFKGVKKH